MFILGTPMHLDPAVTDAFNALFVGHKWWVVLPKDLYEFEKEFTCDKECSDMPKHTFGANGHPSEDPDPDIANIIWYKHILPQLRYSSTQCKHLRRIVWILIINPILYL